MSETWEAFDELFKAVRKQAARIEELERRADDLERRLNKSNVVEFKPVGSGAELKSEGIRI